MPKYCYRCKQCAHAFEIIHSISERMMNCPECNQIDGLDRIPQLLNIIRKDSVGNLVEKAIKENRDLLKEQKNTKREDYKS